MLRRASLLPGLLPDHGFLMRDSLVLFCLFLTVSHCSNLLFLTHSELSLLLFFECLVVSKLLIDDITCLFARLIDFFEGLIKKISVRRSQLKTYLVLLRLEKADAIEEELNWMGKGGKAGGKGGKFGRQGGAPAGGKGGATAGISRRTAQNLPSGRRKRMRRE